jgi:hypothetical protein
LKKWTLLNIYFLLKEIFLKITELYIINMAKLQQILIILFMDFSESIKISIKIINFLLIIIKLSNILSLQKHLSVLFLKKNINFKKFENKIIYSLSKKKN